MESDFFIVRHWDMGQCRTIKTARSHHLKPYTTPLILRRICRDRVVMLINKKILSNKKFYFGNIAKTEAFCAHTNIFYFGHILICNTSHAKSPF